MPPEVLLRCLVTRAALVTLAAEYKAWDSQSDPHGDHDRGAVTLDGVRYVWKIHHHDVNLECHSPNPYDPAAARRGPSVCRAEEC